MRFFLGIIVLAMVGLLGAEKSFADAEAKQGYFTVMGSYIDDDKDRNVEDGVSGGQFGIGYSLSEHFNIEAMYQAAKPGGQQQSVFGVDLQWVLARSGRFSPYLHAGAGTFFLNPASPGSVETGGTYSYGAGFLFDLFSSNVALRGEWRERVDSVWAQDLTDSIFSLGLQIPFGASTPKWSDTDRDGVLDGIDRCPNTPAGATVDAYGCAMDSDGDGVNDLLDRCPGTPAGVSVDSSGCPLDGDGDGVTDDKDQCPSTVAGASVDEKGCELDSDNDGVVDRLDDCPNTEAGVQVDIRGCEIKEEITLRGVTFETNSDRLAADTESVLDNAAATLKKNPTIKVEVAGHTDSDGTADFNEGLSTRRAQTVHDYLVSGGIAADRMSVRGYGELQPIADNSTAAGKASNRRVVLRITER